MSIATLLYSITIDIFRFGVPALIFIGSLSCILNLLVFTKSTLRKNPCTICFITVNILNFLHFYLIILTTALEAGYNINPSGKSIHFCRFRYYFGYVFAALEASCLILASIDRILVTSSKAGIRKLSSPRLISIRLIGCTSFWLVFHIDAFLFMQLLEYAPNSFVCYYQPGAYTVFIAYYLLFINGLLPPLLMAIFGCWTLKNVRQVGRAVHRSRATNTGTAAVGRHAALRNKDHQLIRMLLVDILTYNFCKIPLAIYYIYEQTTQYEEKSSDRALVERCILLLTYFIFCIEPSISGYTNILVSKTFRTEIKRIIFDRHR